MRQVCAFRELNSLAPRRFGGCECYDDVRQLTVRSLPRDAFRPLVDSENGGCMAIHVHLASLLLLAAVPLSAQTNPALAPSPTKADAPTTDSKAVPKQPTPTVFQAGEGDR